MPVHDRRTRRRVDPRVHAAKQQIAGVNHVCPLEEDHGVAARVSGAEVAHVQFLVAEIDGPGVLEGRIGHDERRGRGGARCGRLRRCLLGDLALPGDAVLVGEDALHRGAERAIAAGVVAVVMGVDQQLDALGRPLFEACDADLGGLHELAVDRHRAVAVHEISDGPAVAGEVADAAADLFELGDRCGLCRWCGRRRAGLRGQRTSGQPDRSNGQRRSRNELATIHAHCGLLDRYLATRAAER